MSAAVKPPSPVLRIGVVGHTSDLPLDQLNTTIKSVLDLIQAQAQAAAAASGTAYSSTQCRFGLISCLAPGADQLVADIAHTRGYTLTCILPSNRDKYRQRLGGQASDPVKTFDRLLKSSPAPVVVELAQHDLTQANADRLATRLVVDHCDLVIAIWREADANSGCCTTQGVKEALARGLSVVHIDPRTPSAWSVRRAEVVAASGVHAAPELASRVRAVLADPFAPDGSPKAPPPGLSHALHWLRPPKLYGVSDQDRAGLIREDQHTRRTRFYAEPPRGKATGLAGFWNDWFYEPAKRTQKKLEAAFKNSPTTPTSPTSPLTGIPPQATPTPALPQASVRMQATFEEHFQAADSRAIWYMDCYRSAFAGTYILGVLAVLFAVLAFARCGGGEWAALAFALAELLIVWTIWRIYRRAKDDQWHVRAVDYRLLAEMLRHAQQLSLVGGILPEARLPEHWRDGANRGLWVYWYYRALIRELDFGLRDPATFDGRTLVIDDTYVESCRFAFASDNWIGGQVAYHAVTSRRYALIEWRLERAGTLLFALVALSCLVHLGLPLVMELCGPSAAADAEHHGFDWHKALDIVLVCIGAGAPALAAAFHAISTQAEASRLAESYERMEAMLEESLGRLARLPRPVSLDDLTKVAYDATAVMMAEVEDWQTAYRFHEVTTA